MRKNLIYILLGTTSLTLAGFRVYQHFQYENFINKTETKTGEKIAGLDNPIQDKAIRSAKNESSITNTTISDDGLLENENNTQGETPDKNKIPDDTTITEQELSLAKAVLEEQYDVFIKNQHYSPEETKKFTELLALLDYVPIEEIRNFDEERVKEIKQKSWDNMRAFLGENRYQEFLIYDDSISERARVENLNEELSSDDKLDDDTREKLILAMYKERKKLEAPGGVLSSENIDSKGIKFKDIIYLNVEK